MSDSDSGESEVFDLDSDSGSDDFDPDVAKKKVVPKAKAAPKPKAAPAAKAKAAPKPKKKAPLAERDENGDSDDDMDVDDDEVAPLAGPSKPKAPAKKKTASEMYEKLTPREHVLKRPDTYVGSTGIAEGPMWVYNEEDKKMTFKEIKYVPALYKIFDEILVNAADNKVRDPSMANLKVSIDVEKREISVFNDGAGIPIEMHKKEDMWIPSLIFGVLLTSSNYDDDEDKVTGGRNGYGAKLTNIYSTKFKLETGNKKAGKVFEQTWTDHMAKAGEAKIRSKSTPDFTRVTFTPDLSLFPAMENGFDADMVALFQKRVWDMAGITQGVNVYLNGEKLSGKTFGFKQYVEMFANGVNEVTGQNKKGGALAGADMAGVDAVAAKPQLIYEKFSDSWEVAFAVSDGQFQQLSYCNAIATTKGGAHVNYIADQIVAGVVDLVKKKNKNAPVKPFQIKNHISLYINCLIVNPTFNSQTKEEMTLKSSQYKDRKCKISEEFLKKVAKSGIVDNILYWAKAKQDQLMKKTDGTKRSRITGLAKLEDANNAGTRSGNKCTLILTEGDSAKSLAISGINVVGRDNYGVFPLRGKLLNVREANGKQLLENAEIQAIKQIMGLQQGKVYTSTDSLRYGSLMIMADQDHDGSHIKGLIINFLDYFFPSLLRLPDFLLEFITPIVKATKGKKTESFFTIPQYEAWKEETNNGKGWSIKYFKGLGTSTAADAKKYFSDLKLHRLPFSTLKDEERLLIDMAFNKKKADDRKEWLRGFVPGTYMDHDVAKVKIGDFINNELILFSMADNIRSIPSVVDGFKPGQRKVLFGTFKKKLKGEIKVAQLAGYVSEQSAYHHGEVSLTGTIVGLAQNFVGSNNLNFLEPNGQFGTRLQGGKDAASARYIFTDISPITRKVFIPADDNVLTYLNDDGQSIEPEWYIPILPMVLVNGSDGIGTGWSSSVPNYNPIDIVENLKRKLNDEEYEPMHPWYRGFRGTIEKAEKESYKITGTISQIDDETVEITELPIRSWTQSYKEMLEGMVASTEKNPALIKDYKEYHTDTTVHFVISLTGKGKETVAKDGLEKMFKTSTKISTSNMVCFDVNGKIKKYSTPEEILDDFFHVRKDFYFKRKQNLLKEMNYILTKLSNQARFVKMIIEDKLVISKRKRADICAELRRLEFDPFPASGKARVAADPDATVEEEEEEEEGSDSDFNYLLNMSLSSLTKEKVEQLLAEEDAKTQEVIELGKLTVETLWIRDLDQFTTLWEELLEKDIGNRNKSLQRLKTAKSGKAKKKAVGSDDDSEEEFMPKAKPKPKAKPAPKPKPIDEIMSEAPKPKAAPKPKKPSVALPSSDSGVSEVVAVAKAAPAPKKRVVPDDDSDDEFGAPAVVKTKPAAKKAKKVVESDVDMSEHSDQDAFWEEKPPTPKKVVKKKPAVKKALAGSDSELEIMEVKKKAPAKKVAASASKPAPVKKPAPKKKPKSSDDEDDFGGGGSDSDDDVVVAPKARTARAAATKKAAYVLDLSDEEEEEASDFEESD